MREQYNHLLSLLKKNAKYQSKGDYSPIPEDEMYYFNKSHQALFSCVPDGEVRLAIINRSGYHVALYYDNLINRPHGEDL